MGVRQRLRVLPVVVCNSAYRFLSNKRVSEADVLAGHFRLTRDRAAAAKDLIFVLHDYGQHRSGRAAGAGAGS